MGKQDRTPIPQTFNVTQSVGVDGSQCPCPSAVSSVKTPPHEGRKDVEKVCPSTSTKETGLQNGDDSVYIIQFNDTT